MGAIPVHVAEPISMNAAEDVGRFLREQKVQTVTVVTPPFRSRRSALVCGAALGPGISVYCDPVQGSRGAAEWTGSWHGVQDVVDVHVPTTRPAAELFSPSQSPRPEEQRDQASSLGAPKVKVPRSPACH